MQVTKSQLERQQLILKALGFYFGKLDGIWGPMSIEAKKKYEADASFRPGIPNNGMPFGERPPYPAGITLDHATGLLHHPRIDLHTLPTAAPQPSEEELEQLTAPDTDTGNE
jgi:hypothetical protein